jgi:type III secretory pathway component EscR
MKPNSKSLIFTFAIITTIIFLIRYGLSGDEADPALLAPSQETNQMQTKKQDPFKEFLDEQQQGAISPQPQPSSSQPNLPLHSNNTNSATSSNGTDPFRDFLDAQAKSQKETSAVSPFAPGK